MTAAAKKIGRELGQLSMEDLLALHEHLVASIHRKEETKQLNPAFREKIRQRIEEIDSGKAEGVDAFHALEKM